MKKHKSKKSVQKIASDGNAEVFVLSPEILAKLGINIQMSQVADTNLVTDLEQDPVNTPKTLQNGKPESSIIETASLMKESVFLSPTFNDSTSNAITEVPESVSEDVSHPIMNNNVEHFNSANITNDCLEDDVIHNATDNNSIDLNNDTQIEHTNDLGPYESIEEYHVNNQDGSLVLTENSCKNTPNVESCNEETRVITPFKEDTNGSYVLPDNANNISENVTENMHCKDNDSSNKIKIISEEVIFDLVQLKKVTNLKLSNDATLIPITVDTVVTGKSVQNEFNSSKNISPLGRFTSQQIVDQLVKTNNLSEAENVQSQKMSSHVPENVSPRPIIKEVEYKEAEYKKAEYKEDEYKKAEYKEAEYKKAEYNEEKAEYKEDEYKEEEYKEDEYKKAEYKEAEYKKAEYKEATASVDNSEDAFSKNMVLKNESHNETDTSPSHITDPFESNDIQHCNGDAQSNENVFERHTRYEAEYKANDFQTAMQLNGDLDIINKKSPIEAEIETKKLTVITTASVENSEDVLSKNIVLENKLLNETDLSQPDITAPIESNDSKRWNGDTPSNENVLKIENVNNCDTNRENQSEDHRDSESPKREIEKVKEIASYLKQIANLRRKSNSERKIVQTTSQKNVKELDNTQTEKDQHKIKFGKTYQRTAINKQIPAAILMSQEYADSFQLSNELNFINENNGDLSKSNICICYDFGNLSYYDGEILYEHIHFRENKSTKCDAKIVYSIYNDRPRTPTEFEAGIENLHEDDEIISDNFCWNDFATETNDNVDVLYTSDNKDVTDTTIEIEIDAIEPAKSISSASEKKNDEIDDDTESILNTVIGNRKRSQSMEKTRNSESESKTTVECGVCNKIILDTEWETHKEKEHDCIAWKVDEHKIDFTNGNLMRDISQRLKVVGSLICPICNTKMKQLKKITQHVEKCIKRKEVVIPDPTPESSSPTRPTRRSLRNSTVSNQESDSAPVKLNTSNSERNVSTVACSSLKIKTINKNSKPIENEKLPASKELSSPKVLMTYSRKTKSTSNMDSGTFPNNIKLEITDPLPSSKDFQSNDSIGELTASTIVENVETPLRKESEKNPKSPQKRISIRESITFENDSFTNVRSRNAVCKEPPVKIEIQGSISNDSIECGVCKKIIENDHWSDHLSKEHNYLAWREGDPGLNLKDDEQVKSYLQNISKQLGGLVCSKCGTTRKFAKRYLSHVKTCKGDGLNVSSASRLNSTLDNDDDDDEALSVVQSRKSRKRKSMPTQVMVVCGVCKTTVSEQLWIQHIQTEHKYLAWKDGEKPIDLNSEDEVKNHLNDIAKIHGLICNECGITWRYVKKYLTHDGLCKPSQDDASEIAEYKCGVCHEKGKLRDWRTHAMKVHYNLAWMADQEPIDLKDPSVIDKCLKEYRLKYSLICNKCKTARASSFGFYAHIMTCGKTEQEIDAFRDECEICGEKYLCVYKNQHMNMHKDKESRKRSKMSCDPDDDFVPETENLLKRTKTKGPAYVVNIKQEASQNTQDGSHSVEIELNPLLKCGVCKADVVAKDWINHIQKQHAYLAWIEGEEPLDTENADSVRQHLIRILNTVGELVCNKCGTSRKNEHGYRQHVPACDSTGFKLEITVPLDLKKDEYECGVCHERGLRKEFKEHAMKKHYNIAWLAGDLPINLRNFYAVEKFLKEYQANYALVCNVCKATRTSCYGFYAHILQCGKSKEELEAVHSVCDICNNKYLCIYRNQHMAMHREQNYKKDLKILQEQKKAEEKKNKKVEQESSNQTPRKRKAALKATGFIKKHSTTIVNVDGKLVCSCGTTFSNEQEQSEHKCRDEQEADMSVKMEAESSDTDSDVDSNISADEDTKKQTVKVRQGEGTPKVARMPFRVDNYSWHLDEGYNDFCKLHYTTEILFEEWRNTEYSLVPQEDIEKYLPPLKESCKVKFGTGEWKTYKRFQSTKTQGMCLFTGGTIQCISWVPSMEYNSEEDHYLCVASHRGGDVPRCSPAERGRDQALLQIWRFGDFSEAPQLSLALALDFGIIWAIDWCPSGARDPMPEATPTTDDPTVSSARLGLLAVACSDGGAYIFAVPYSSQHTELEKIMYKLKPVAELRISMSAGRRVYQATSIHWSHQKGHKIIIVGYSDGTTALYDLNTESPLLRGNENGVHIFYPFEDKLSESTAITGTVLIPSNNVTHAAGSVCSASVTGGTLRSGAASVRCHLPAAAAAPAPLWPAVVMYNDGPLTAKIVTEVEWCGGGRRLGSARCGAACVRCGRLASVCSPAVRILRSHPIYPEIKKLIIATLVMTPLNMKSRRKINDDLSTVVEPLTYDDAVSKYGLVLSYVDRKHQHEAQKVCNDNETRPERFPLSEIIASAFCPSPRFHEKLALATHAGLVFVINS